MPPKRFGRIESTSTIRARGLQLRVRSSGASDIYDTVILLGGDNPRYDGAHETEAGAGEAADSVSNLGADAEAHGRDDAAFKGTGELASVLRVFPDCSNLLNTAQGR